MDLASEKKSVANLMPTSRTDAEYKVFRVYRSLIFDRSQKSPPTHACGDRRRTDVESYASLGRFASAH
jgi:hypothetical protein